MDKRQFILDTLLPYFKDPSSCGFTREGCVYLTLSGKTCAFGQHIVRKKYDSNMEGKTASRVLELWGTSVLTPEAQALGLSGHQWNEVQRVHDSLAGREDTITEAIEVLESGLNFKFPELYEEVNKLRAAGYFTKLPTVGKEG